MKMNRNFKAFSIKGPELDLCFGLWEVGEDIICEVVASQGLEHSIVAPWQGFRGFSDLVL